MQRLPAHFSLTLPCSIHGPNLIRSVRLFSTSINSPPEFLPSYLVTKCGFSHEKAAEATKLLRRVKSPDQLDSVIAFFKSQGFDESHITKLLRMKPQWLARDVEETFAPKVRILHEIGITGNDLVVMLLSYPHILDHNIQRSFVPKIEFWRRIAGYDKLLSKCLKMGQWMFSRNIEKLQKNVSFLQECGLSDHQISSILTKQPSIISQKPETLNELVSRVETLGLPRGSPNFHWALYTLSKINEANLRAKMKLLNGFGWSEDDFAKAFRKAPVFFTSSLKLLEEKMEFLVKEGGCTASYIALNPVLLTLSIEKRLRPRLKVLKALEEKELSCRHSKLAYAMTIVNNKFFERYVAPYNDSIPELRQFFSASS